MYKLMTAGPTQVRENVMLARSRAFENPDTDENFYDFYKETCEMISELLHTKSESLILGGEGILGLEAVCATLTEKDDRVLVLDNGIFGEGFKDFVTMYGGNPILYTKEYDKPFNIEELEAFLKIDSNFKYATLVHCDTPSGLLNDCNAICNLLKSYNILTVVDAVSSMFGEYINMDDFGIDMLCGGSQKVISAPPGLSIVTISEKAKQMIKERKTPIASFYANLSIFENYYETKWFPYTMPISDIYGLRTAIENIKHDKNILKRHKELAKYVRESLVYMGLTLYLKDGFSSTATAFNVPTGYTDNEIILELKEKHNILITGSFGCFKGKLLRIGHMGENANKADIENLLKGLKEILNR